MLIICLILSMASAFAVPVLHQIRPDSSFTQISTLDACSFMVGRQDSVECNPSLFPYQKAKGVSFSLATVADGDSVDTGQKLIFSKIQKEDINELFAKRAFTSLDANSGIKFMTPYFFLYYRPLTISADLLVINPAFPEISMALVKNKQIGATTGFEVLNNTHLKVSLGANLFHYQRDQYIGSFSLVDLTNNDVDELIKFKNRQGVAADIGLTLRPTSAYLPGLSLLAKNIGSDFSNPDKDVRSEKVLRPLFMYENYSRLGLFYRFNFKYGGLGMELNQPFQGNYAFLMEDYRTASLGYFLGGFSVTGAISKFQKIVGLKFSSNSLSMGVFYAFNQSLGDYYHRKENLAGLQVQVNL